MESTPECLALLLVRCLARLKAEVLPEANCLKCCAKLSLGHLHQLGASRLPEFVQHRWSEKTGPFPNFVCVPDCNFKRRIFCRLDRSRLGSFGVVCRCTLHARPPHYQTPQMTYRSAHRIFILSAMGN